jgi:hypothetical protein
MLNYKAISYFCSAIKVPTSSHNRNTALHDFWRSRRFLLETRSLSAPTRVRDTSKSHEKQCCSLAVVMKKEEISEIKKAPVGALLI